ncbi:LytR C-terminal domain-containing protein [Streptomyces sp. Je 1-4]|uniref:LytR C-terminal domain-containing protein n=1 Tax=Streptomyces TaxID=1883 RepID=UPI0021DA7AC7|nr:MULTISPECIES: LytR C-terminal domain-containing protein [unclassified Streptomyces]UYB41113.1 LytR C-terminal domain-containing protein [Streptomyces sp. Je 1-4]UZQ37281.1 LytR C-terminal domain-containing protein [Streptomyces sp. Je 1-4] [Streptomyces sp. Je 1-4 4N24]UZQ44698.1 LytR C-terminal domain-containing protein [Streptomyces sp. Je 1-4] [Streptomyces sp. Je 1-4 4N24_ara]
MSMLTPPGMGGKKYRITGDRYPRMRRPRHRRRIVLSLVAAACALGLAGWGTLQLIDVFGGRSNTAHAGQDKQKCPDGAGADAAQAKTAARKLPAPGTLTVNVFNATPRSGLAKRTADELQKRGFKIGKVGNAPAAYDKKIKGAGILLGPKAAVDGPLKVLATQLTGAQQKTDTRKGAELDLIIGDAFKALATQQDATKSLSLLTRPSPAPAGDAKC